jgi:hypothetical protein
MAIPMGFGQKNMVLNIVNIDLLLECSFSFQQVKIPSSSINTGSCMLTVSHKGNLARKTQAKAVAQVIPLRFPIPRKCYCRCFEIL